MVESSEKLDAFVAPEEEGLDGEEELDDTELEERIRTNVPRTIMSLGRRLDHGEGRGDRQDGRGRTPDDDRDGIRRQRGGHDHRPQHRPRGDPGPAARHLGAC